MEIKNLNMEFDKKVFKNMLAKTNFNNWGSNELFIFNSNSII